MSNYTSGNNAPTLMAQAPNRKGNISKSPQPSHKGGATAVTRPSGGTVVAGPNQGAAKANGNIYGRNQKVTVTTHCDYDGRIKNDGYLNADRTNYLK
jgi:hypothetical protein